MLTSERLASGSDDRSVRVWATETGECVKTLRAFAHVNALLVLDAGRLVCAGSDDGRILVWQTATGTCVRQLKSGDQKRSSGVLSLELIAY